VRLSPPMERWVVKPGGGDGSVGAVSSSRAPLRCVREDQEGPGGKPAFMYVLTLSPAARAWAGVWEGVVVV
jgi:hypothetical protein